MSHRRAKLGHELAQRLALILETKVSDPRLHEVVVVGVEAAPDASFARVYYRTFGDRAPIAEALERAKPFIRRRLAEGLRLRRVPELDFRHDPSLEQGDQMLSLLRDIANEQET